MIRVLVVLLIFGSNLSDQRLDQLASGGNIQENAPVKAASEITINAPPERVWELLTNVKEWPKWQPDITKAEMSGPLQRGTDFTWTTGTQIRSRVALVQPRESLSGQELHTEQKPYTSGNLSACGKPYACANKRIDGWSAFNDLLFFEEA